MYTSGTLVALSELEYYYTKQDGYPTFLDTESVTRIPEVYIRNRASFGSSDLPVAFHFVVIKAVNAYRLNYPEDNDQSQSATRRDWPVYCADTDYNNKDIKQKVILSRTLKANEIFKKVHS